MKLIPVAELSSEYGRRRQGGPIYWRGTIEGLGRKVIGLGVVDWRLAKQAAQRKIRELLRREESKATDTTFADFADAVYTAKVPVWRFRTQWSAKNHIYNFLIPFFGNYPLTEITDVLWGKFVADILEAFPDRDLRNTRKYMRMIMVKARRAGLVTSELELQIPASPESPGKWIPKDQVEALIAVSRGRLQLAILFAYLMGMRWNEIIALGYDRVDLEKGLLRLGKEHTKTKRPRTIAIHPLVLDILRRERKQSDSRWVFPLRDGRDGHIGTNTLQYDWTVARRAAQVDCRFHDLRHSWICEMLFVHKEHQSHVSEYGGLSLRELKTYTHHDPERTRQLANAMQISAPLRLSMGHVSEQGE